MESTLQLAMKLDPREVNHHLSTVFWLMEVTKFLHSCELEERHVMDLIPELLQPLQSSRIFGTKRSSCSVPTLFGSNIERMQLAVLVMLCGKTVDEGFGLAFRLVKQLVILHFEMIIILI
jgi:zinc finger FYVE domain-containing protein 26